MRSPVRVIVGAVAVALVVAGCGSGEVASVQATPIATVSELATARATLASQQATIADLTARLTYAERDISSEFVMIADLSARIRALENP